MQHNALFPHHEFKNFSMQDSETHCHFSFDYLNLLDLSLTQWSFTS